jgi:hypothetical protein
LEAEQADGVEAVLGSVNQIRHLVKIIGCC